MPLITLTTDWGLRDQHVSVLKGMLLNKIPKATIIDISHDVQPFNIAQAAYLFRNAYTHFAESTLHIIGVSSFAGNDTELIAIKKNSYGFIGMNDGFFSLVFDDKPVDMITLSPGDNQFTAYDFRAIVNATQHILAGKNIYELGGRPAEFVMRGGFRPVIEEDVIRGSIIYIDEMGNVITNIDKKLFEEQRSNRNFEINARRQQYLITTLSTSYAEVERGNLLALFNTGGFLEIAINQGNAAMLLGLKHNDTIRIDFT